MGYVKGGSKPSLIAGLGLGASYGVAGVFQPRRFHVARHVVLTQHRTGYLLRENKDYGSEVAFGSSLALFAAATSRCIKTNWRAPVPLGLFATSSVASWYFLKKYKELNYGV